MSALITLFCIIRFRQFQNFNTAGWVKERITAIPSFAYAGLWGTRLRLDNSRKKTGKKKTKVSHSMVFILNACGLSLVQYRPSLSAKTLLAWTSATDGAPASSSEVLYCQWNLWGLMVKILYAICPFCHQPTMSKLWRSKQWTTNDIQGRAQDSSWGKTEGPKAKSGDGVLGEGAATHSLPVNEPGERRELP